MSTISSILLYLIVFGLSAFIIQFGYRRKSKALQGIGLLFPILLGGLRYDVGLDYIAYFDAYADIVNPQSTLRYEGTPGLEVTFQIIAHISNFISSSPVLLFTTYCAITVLAFYAALRVMKPNNVGFAMFFFYAIFFLNSFNIMRQGVAMSIGALAIAHYVNGRRRKGVVYVLLASLFHISALLILGYMSFEYIMERRYLVKKKITRFSRLFFKVFMVSIAVIVLGLSVASVADYIYNATGRIGEFGEQAMSMGVIFKYLLAVSILFVSIYAWKYLSIVHKRLVLFVSLGVIVYALGVVHGQSARIGMYLLTLVPILAAIIYDMLPRPQLKGRLFVSTILAALCTLYIVSVHVSADEGVRYNYQSIIGSDDYQKEVKTFNM